MSIARTAIEVTLGRGNGAEDEYRDSLGVVAEQVRRLGRIVEDLFTLARADAAGLPLDRGPLYLDELVADCVRETSVLAGPKGVSLDGRGESDLEIRGRRSAAPPDAHQPARQRHPAHALRWTSARGLCRPGRTPSSWRSRTAAEAFQRRTASASSTASSVWTRRTDPARGRAWACPSPEPSPRRTAARSSWRAATPPGARSSHGCLPTPPLSRRHHPFIRPGLSFVDLAVAMIIDR